MADRLELGRIVASQEAFVATGEFATHLPRLLLGPLAILQVEGIVVDGDRLAEKLKLKWTPS
jgi:hypothetical protein